MQSIWHAGSRSACARAHGRIARQAPRVASTGPPSWLSQTRSASSTLVQPGDTWGAPIEKKDTIGSANLDWESLGFDYVPTNGHVRYVWKNGVWDAGRVVEDPYISVHILGNVFHYGQALFEGFKGYHTRQGDVCVFADHMCYNRMAHGTRRFRMPQVSRNVWDEAIDIVVRKNQAYIPPYGTGGALYVRPFVFGSGPRLGLGPSPEYTFIVFANPVGSYYKQGDGALQAVHGMVNDEYDRAAPLGCGDVKAAGNYAADLESMHVSKRKGFPIGLYLDAKERRYVEEFNTSNFVAITKDGRYLTPDAPRSVLDSNTNKILQQLATDMGIKVEKRKIDFEAEVDNFAEVGAVGTAVVVTPLKSLTRGEKVWQFGEPKVLQQLSKMVRGIQTGDEPDRHHWMRRIPVDDSNSRESLLSIYPGL
eukprot:TRINITY_DN3884_c0_g1_i4.p1 TRINITY_DN3884_c0_g1~~TRINITY_DN3884_c0_g1_i4.p1  ORF type:complete len:421 (-),score=63.37 TRINITY_DN3884_c0_g1_i4:111-1373(-)